MKFSVCIPNYNYERYLGKTIQSVLDQTYQDFEILISDNASTDRSVEIARGFNDPRIKIHINRRNVGFSGNLDRAGRMATGDYMIMLSSDDLILPDALKTYRAFLIALGSDANRCVISSAWDIIDPNDKVIGESLHHRALWYDSDRATEYESLAGGETYRAEAGELLRRCLLEFETPFNFAATCYPRQLYDKVEGYGGGRLISPDCWFHWKLLSVAQNAYFIESKFFAYRWHLANQTAQQASIGALKLAVDEYASTLEIDEPMLSRAKLSKQDVIAAFIEHGIARHGLATLARGDRSRAKRLFNFGKSVYPAVMRSNRKVLALQTLLALGPIGKWIAFQAYRRYH